MPTREEPAPGRPRPNVPPGIQSTATTVPNVVGMTIAEAEQKLEAAGFEVVARPARDARVNCQHPKAEAVSKSRFVIVTPEMECLGKVPAIGADTPIESAQWAVEAQGLELGVGLLACGATTGDPEEYPDYVVLKQCEPPEVGASIPCGNTVGVLIQPPMSEGFFKKALSFAVPLALGIGIGVGIGYLVWGS